MARRRLRLAPAVDGAELRRRFTEIRADLGVPQDFSPEVIREAEASVWHGEEPDADLRDVAFVTIDPPGSMDLDQAVYIARDGDGYRLDYAIADIPGFVDPQGPLARETLRRGQTLYSPDCRTPLHPQVLSEDGASLLPGRDRPAIVWRFRLDAAGEVERVDVARALVRSRERLDYAGVLQRVERTRSRGGVARDPADMIASLLEEVGVRRLAVERARGGASLPLPDQEVEPEGNGFVLRLRPKLASEEWNAQISLMTGMAAASIMLEGGIGILRTLPAAPPPAVDRLRAQASALGTPWPQDETYGGLLSRLDPGHPAELALLHSAASLLRGSGYTAFDGCPPAFDTHAAVAAPYAHVTAPLRRLVDRFTLACCLALANDREVPGWVRDGLSEVPERMRASDALAGELERRCLDAVEVASLACRPDDVFEAVVVDVAKDGGSGGGRVLLTDPPVLARCDGPVQLGASVAVRLVRQEPWPDQVRFAPA